MRLGMVDCGEYSTLAFLRVTFAFEDFLTRTGFSKFGLLKELTYDDSLFFLTGDFESRFTSYRYRLAEVADTFSLVLLA